MQRQLALFARDEQPGFDPAFARARRSQLADGAWVEEVPGWVRGHERLATRSSRRCGAGGESIAYNLGQGDLLVMGGSCQRTWRHGIPKVAAAGPRIAIMFRPTWVPG